MSESRSKVMLIDGNSILNRAFYALQGANMLKTRDGLYTNAVYGFLNILNKYVTEDHPQYIAVAFDMKAPTFRHREYEQYKATRKGMPDELACQLPVIKDILDAMNIRRYEIEGYEADDIIGTLSRIAEETGYEVIIVTGDRDSLQLVSENVTVKLPITKGGKTETQVYDPAAIKEKYQSTPQGLIDIKGLMGDSSDNVPGIPGVGEKTAISLIARYGTIEGIYENIDDISSKSLKEKLVNHKDLAYLSRKLVTIDRNVPIEWNPDDIKLKEINKPALKTIFERLEFRSLMNRYGLNEAEVLKDDGSLKIKDSLKAELVEIKYRADVKTFKELADFKLKVINDIEKTEYGKFLKIAIVGEPYRNKNSVCPGEGYTLLTILTEKGTCAIISMAEDGFLVDGLSQDDFVNEFRHIFNNTKVRIVGHDLKPFLVFLKNRKLDSVSIGFDSKIAAYVIDPSNSGSNLNELVKNYLPEEIDVKNDTVLQAAALFQLQRKMDEVMEANGQKELYYDIELPLVEVLADIEHVGFRVDRETLEMLGRKLDQQIAGEMAAIYELAGEEFNINSPKQLGVILFEKLGLPVTKKTKTGYSTDAETLEQLEELHPIISRIINFRQYIKLKSTYIDGLLAVINPVTGRIHSSFNQTVTLTGRLSSTEPNLQNIPIRLPMGREIRKAFVPSDQDHVLLDADYSQIELRVLAHISGDENMKEAFEKSQDIHTRTASQVFGVPYDEVTPEMRSRAKAVNFGIVYGISDFSLAKDIKTNRKTARAYINNYLENFKGVKKYMADIIETGKKQGYVTTLFNRRRYIPEIKSSNYNIRSFGERVALNTPIQGTAADIIKIAMVKVYRELKKRGLKSKLILQVHDELIIDTLKSEKEEVAKLLKECMENAVKLNVPLSVDIREGENWFYA